MAAIVLDAGALIAVERADLGVAERLRIALTDGLVLRTPAIVLAQVWRDPRGRQARLARAIAGIDVVPVDEALGRRAGVLLGRAGTSDAIDATVVSLAEHGDIILTSGPADIARLVEAAGRRMRVVAC
ncbi:MAG: twitching motility protein PilT [Dehalococcoidia bacterium]